jgi:DNA gyrase/topoisomerase IV subunit B
MFVDILIDIFSGILSGLTGVSRGIIETFFHKKQILKDEQKKQEELSKKLERLTASLHESSVLMSEIEIEFQQQKELAEKWHKEAETSQIIASLNEKEVEAVTKLFGGVLKKDEKKSNRRSWWWNLFFCLLGIVGGYLVSKFLL